MPSSSLADDLTAVIQSGTTTEVPIENGHVIGAVSGQLCRYLHPKLLPILYERAVYGNGPSSAQVFSDFRFAVGLNYAQDDKASWDAWWRKAQPLLEGDMNLQTAKGRERWMERYAQADPATQKILMNLWWFEPTVDEAALIDDAAQNKTAKLVLADLWQRNRLSNDAMKTIVERFITFRLVNEMPDWYRPDKNSYAVTVHFVSSFPFPQNALYDGRVRIMFNDDPSGTEMANWKDASLANHNDGADNKYLSKGGSYSSPPQASAIVEYQGTDFPGSHDVLWTTSWHLGPIQLVNLVP